MDLKMKASVVFSIELSELMNHRFISLGFRKLKGPSEPRAPSKHYNVNFPHHADTSKGIYGYEMHIFFPKNDVLVFCFLALRILFRLSFVFFFFTFTVDAPRKRRLL